MFVPRIAYSPIKLLLTSLVLLWLPIVFALSAHWSVFEDYRYGWTVPFLCLYLVARALHSSRGEVTHSSLPPSAFRFPLFRFPLFRFALCPLLFALLSTTLILQESSPLWRLPSHLLALEGIALTLGLLYFHGGRRVICQLAFPVCFILVAVPWPTPIETGIIQALTRLNTGTVIEILSGLGIPALAHGNLIELSTGVLGMDEACSGIRSTQAALMLSLFFGEVSRHTLRRRLGLVGLGLLLALILNILRTTILAVVAAGSGIAASERWHDGTGVAVLLLCFSLIWLLSRPRAHAAAAHPGVAGSSEHVLASPPFRFSRSALFVCCLPLLSAAACEFWFRLHETRYAAEPQILVSWPTSNPGFRATQFSTRVRAMLRSDTAEGGTWKNSDGTRWQLFHIRWNRAQTRADRWRIQLSKNHKPEVCLPGSGRSLESEFPATVVELGGMEFPFRTYEFAESASPISPLPSPRKLFVFFCVREDYTRVGLPANMRDTHAARFAAAWNGNRGLGMRSIEVAIWGAKDLAHAIQLLRSELPKLVQAQSN